MRLNGTVVGSGLAALDLYKHQNGCFQNVGGTAVNVLSVLASFGHSSHLVGTLGNDTVGREILKQLRYFGVSTDHIQIRNRFASPFLICERSERHSGFGSNHKHRWWCWECERRYPKFEEPADETFASLTSVTKFTDFFFVDRVSAAALKYAKEAKKLGARVFLEPAFTKKTDLLDEFIAIADVVKLSRESPAASQISNVPPYVALIETMGADGIALSCLDFEQRFPAISGIDPIDTSGAGDWCTAGIIHQLIQLGLNNQDPLSKTVLSEAITLGARLGAFACTFLGTTSVLPISLIEGISHDETSWFDNQIYSTALRGVEGAVVQTPTCQHCGANPHSINQHHWTI